MMEALLALVGAPLLLLVEALLVAMALVGALLLLAEALLALVGVETLLPLVEALLALAWARTESLTEALLVLVKALAQARSPPLDVAAGEVAE